MITKKNSDNRDCDFCSNVISGDCVYDLYTDRNKGHCRTTIISVCKSCVSELIIDVFRE